MVGDNTIFPPIDFIELPDLVRPGDRVVSSGDGGGVFPAGLLVGHVAQGSDRRLRVRLAADYERLEFLRVLRSHGTEAVTDPGALVVTNPLPPQPAPPTEPAPPAPPIATEGDG